MLYEIKWINYHDILQSDVDCYLIDSVLNKPPQFLSRVASLKCSWKNKPGVGCGSTREETRYGKFESAGFLVTEIRCREIWRAHQHQHQHKEGVYHQGSFKISLSRQGGGLGFCLRLFFIKPENVHIYRRFLAVYDVHVI